MQLIELCNSASPRTQKARGLSWLGAKFHSTTTTTKQPQERYLLRWDRGDRDDPHPIYNPNHQIPELNTLFAQGAHFRFCPLVPVHGGIESRRCYSRDDLYKLLLEIEESNEKPPYELIVESFIEAKANVILTEHHLTAGAGHDGATSGKAEIEIRTVSKFGNLLRDFHTAPIKESAFTEWILGPTNQIEIVQLRDGPEMQGLDYIPEETTVKKIIVPNEGEELPAWAKRLEVAVSDGLVVWLSWAGITSHFAIHARAKGIPFLSTRKPKLGETLYPPVKSLDFIDVEDLGPLLLRAFELTHADISKLTLTAAAAITHSTATWSGELTNAEKKFLALSVAMVFRATIAACIGEARHSWRKLAKTAENEAVIRLVPVIPKTRPAGTPSRNVMLKRASKAKIDVLLRAVFPLERVFSLHWGANPGYGGAKWKAGAVGAKDLLLGSIIFCKDPTSKNLWELINRLNALVNTLHNGGARIIGKLANEALLNEAANSPGTALIRQFPCLWDCWTTVSFSEKPKPEKIAMKLITKVLEGAEMKDDETVKDVVVDPDDELGSPVEEMEELQEAAYTVPKETPLGLYKIRATVYHGTHLHVQCEKNLEGWSSRPYGSVRDIALSTEKLAALGLLTPSTESHASKSPYFAGVYNADEATFDVEGLTLKWVEGILV